MKWKCSNIAHLPFQLCFHTIKHGNSWCPLCNTYNRPLDITIACTVARDRGGKCLSTEYGNNRTPLEWECTEGHRWMAPLERVKNRGDWCPTCAGNQPQTLEECKRIASLKNGKCLAIKYVNSVTPVRWECSEGHTWLQATGIVKSGHWCPHCYGNAKHTIEFCQEVAEERGGKCLSTEYINTDELMLWECKEKHQWYARFNNIKNQKQWCPTCSSFQSERLARELIENLMQKPFMKIRPDWLEGLELDGYCEEEKMAFEYQGEQHYKFIPFFHRTETAFAEQLIRDKRKKEILKSRGIDLLEIPYTYNYLNESELDDFIEREIQMILARRGEISDSSQLQILSIDDTSITYLDKRLKKTVVLPRNAVDVKAEAGTLSEDT